mgnify:CR=1 FL=1
MNKYRRCVACLLMLLLACRLFTGCGGYMKDNGKPNIVCTIYPEYEWLLKVLGDEADNYNIRLLLDGSTEVHSYQPTAADIAAISACDLLIYVGGEGDKWIEDVLENKTNKNMKIIKLLDCLGERALEEEVVEGMQEVLFGHDHGDEKSDADTHEHTHDESCGHDVENTDHHKHEGVYDEHVWLSLKNARIFVEAIEECVSELWPEKATEFSNNAKTYIESIDALDGEYTELVEEADLNTLLFADRFPFRYLTEDYGLKYYAAFSGCSADAEASFETVVFLAERVKAENIPTVLILESSDETLAETVISTADSKEIKILVLDSMQSDTGEWKEQGFDYLEIMESNLEILKQALGE